MTRFVVGFGTQEHLLVSRIALPRPALRILQTTKTVLVDSTAILYDGIILSGRLQVGCLIAVVTAAPRDAASGDEPPRDAALAVPVEQVSIEHAFTLFLPVPGAADGMDVQVTEAYVAGGATRPATYNPAGHTVTLADQSLLRLSALVTVPTPEIAPPPTAAPAAHPPRAAAAPAAPAAHPPRAAAVPAARSSPGPVPLTSPASGVTLAPLHWRRPAPNAAATAKSAPAGVAPASTVLAAVALNTPGPIPVLPSRRSICRFAWRTQC